MNRSLQHAFEPEEVMAYLDGELEPARAAALAGHLEHCEECRALAAQFRQVSERLLDFQVEPSPASVSKAVVGALDSGEFQEKTLRRTSSRNKAGRWWLAGLSPYAWALGCLLIAAIVVKLGMRHPTSFKASPGEFSRLELMANLERPPEDSTRDSRGVFRYSPRPASTIPAAKGPSGVAGTEGGDSGSLEAPAANGPMIAQSASLTILATNYDDARTAIDRLAVAHGGYVQKLTADANAGSARELFVTLRVPATQLDGFLTDVRKLGHVEKEVRANDEVTDQYVDLQARLKSARATEQRLLDLLATRTGKLDDVLAAEQELARIREEIESMDGQRVLLLHRVNYATVDVDLNEQYWVQLHPVSSSAMGSIRNAFVEGIGNLEDVCVSTLVFLFAYGPSILFWLLILAVPAWLIWRWSRRRSRRLS
jgi:anti-sigma factor RsiW